MPKSNGTKKWKLWAQQVQDGDHVPEKGNSSAGGGLEEELNAPQESGTPEEWGGAATRSIQAALKGKCMDGDKQGGSWQ